MGHGEISFFETLIDAPPNNFVSVTFCGGTTLEDVLGDEVNRSVLMHLFHTAVLFVVLTLLGVEFSVSAFTNPLVWRLEPASQWKALSRNAVVGGKVMPVWYLGSTLLSVIQTWLCWHTSVRSILLTVDAIFVLIAVASIFVLVPLNNRVAEGAADWQRIHRTWDGIHRVRIAALAAAALLLTYVIAH